ncbi:hypothetical protein GX51_08313 [Blastomyces parvus]|uniref:Uncharacterized protein n=1 Tax=Blastomyces parvus TaxID=2060905 RepID=A0A2B7WF18_9EURO|nr:hypothetical protein GX51_08313 [Blastomyces parvus]
MASESEIQYQSAASAAQLQTIQCSLFPQIFLGRTTGTADIEVVEALKHRRLSDPEGPVKHFG